MPAPREPSAILAEIDALSQPDTSSPGTSEGWSELRRKNNELAARRVGLISELEESGYVGERLLTLLQAKLRDSSMVAQQAYGPLNKALGLMWEVRDSHKGKAIGALAQLHSYGSVLLIMGHAGMQVAERDVRAIADAEELAVKVRDSDAVGSTLANAIRHTDNAARPRWYDWMVEHLPPDSFGYRTAMGERAFGRPIELSGPTLDGGKVSTQDWRGSVVLVDFWGTWCGPCKAEMPEIARLQAKYGARGLKVIGVLEDVAEPARKYVAEKGYTWPQLVDPEHANRTDLNWDHPIARRYGVNAFPTIWLIDRGGVLHRGPAGDQQLEKKVLELLDEAAPAPSGGPEPGAP